MNCEQAKNINMVNICRNLNIENIRLKKATNKAVISSPFRRDKKPSFYLFNNRWKDLATGEKGDVVDFIEKYESLSTAEALKYLDNLFTNLSRKDNSFFSFQGQSSSDSQNKIINIKRFVQHKALINYLKLRAIDPYKVRNDVCEIWHLSANKKKYFGIGFINDLGGYEVRNKYIPVCVGPKTISTIKNGSERIVLFEGFFDYLSYKMLNWSEGKEDYMVLNTVNNYKRAIPILKKYKKILAFLDNDDRGKDCFEDIKKEVPWIIDQSHTFYPFKDLNEFLMNQKK